MRIVGVLLAAGAGTRFGGGKLLAPLDGVAIGRRSCANLVAAVQSVIAVVRPGDDALAAQLSEAGASVTICALAATGMGASLAHGVREARDTEAADAVMVALADMPWIAPATYRSVRAELEKGAPVAIARYRGARAHPVGFARQHFPALMQLTGDAGARELIARARDIRWVDVDDPGAVRDVDTQQDLTG